MNIRNSFYKTLRPFKSIKVFLKKKAGWLGVPKIVLYRGFGNEKEGWITGRVIEDSGLAKPEDAQKVWKNLLATIKRYTSDAYIGIRVEARQGSDLKETITDEYGFFRFHFEWKEKLDPDNSSTWLPVQIRLLDHEVESQHNFTIEGEVNLIFQNQKRIIISDIDDTVMVSHSTRLIKKLRLMFFKNAYSRLTFDGTPEFYQALARGKSGEENHPFFFVSSSEWNLYDLLDDFFVYNKIPRGIFLLQRFSRSSLRFWKSGTGTHQHKLDKIRELLEVYKTQTFVLIGDSGQNDTSIYQQLAGGYPERIESIYIRKVKTKKNDQSHKMTKTPGSVKAQYIEFGDSYSAMEHARKHEYIQ